MGQLYNSLWNSGSRVYVEEIFSVVDKDVSGTEANLAQARQRSVMAHRILIKLKEMGLPENLDEELSKLCTDLGDI